MAHLRKRTYFVETVLKSIYNNRLHYKLKYSFLV